MDAAPAPLVRMTGLTKSFGSFRAVDDFSLDIVEGEFFALLGGSGSGKSTILRMLAGFEAPTSGRIEIAGQDMAGVPPNARPVNIMFQAYALFPHMTAAQNIEYGLRKQGLPRAERAGEVKRMLDLVQMSEFGKRRPHQLSGGQRQRIALARALARKPRLLLLDEPLGALDRRLREKMQLELKRIQKALGITFVVVTHDQEEALSLADRVAVLEKGRLQQCGTPQDIYSHPAKRFVADFIGSINMLPAVVAGPGCARLDDGVVLHVPTGDAREGARVFLAIRPENVQRAPAEQAENVIMATVQDHIYLGREMVVQLRMADGQPISIIALAVSGQVPLLPGQSVRLALPSQSVRVLTE